MINEVEFEDALVELTENGSWINPVNGGNITSSYGTRINPITSRQEFHNGIDIPASFGSPVYAVADGMIIQAGTSPSWGNYIEYEVDGYSLFYAHLSQITVRDGGITRGQEIGKIGSTGLSTGPHLHLTLKKDGVEIDPLSYFDYKLSDYAKSEYIKRGEPVPDGY